MDLNNKVFRYIRRIFFSDIKSGKQIQPEILSYLITNLCNSHCITCNIWREKNEKIISKERLEQLLSDNLFSEVKHVGISGGEPSIFSDFVDYLKIILSKLPKIENLSITSNCIQSDFWIENLPLILEFCRQRNVAFQMNISLDGLGILHNQIRGTKDNFSSFEQVAVFLKQQRIPFQIHSTINKHNVYHIGAILHYAKEHGYDILFRLASEIHRLDNEKLIEEIQLNDNQKSFLCDFLISDNLLSYTKSPGRRLYYKNLVKQLLSKSQKRTAPCYFKNSGIVLSSDGSLLYCSRFNKPFIENYTGKENIKSTYFNSDLRFDCMQNRCETCYHDQNGFWTLKEVINEVVGNRFLIFKKMFTICENLSRAGIFKTKERENKTVVHSVAVIGMYGGEHVGDAAILGGVIKRLIKKYPSIDSITVYSFRKDRTERWLRTLTHWKDLKISVEDNDKQFEQIIKNSQLLAWAGGPVMELPVVLSRNYCFMKHAHVLGKKIEIIGVGYGPINSIFGKKITERILKMADFISARSAKDAEKLKCYSNFYAEQDCYDPAFDYLALLDENLSIDDRAKKQIDNILKKVVGKKKIALNLRPLWNRYGKNETFNLDVFLSEVVALIRQLSENNYAVIFFPMNADQYGFSDLDVAYVINAQLGMNKESFYIWETEPAVNDVIYLLRNVDVAVCMRFHAAIFAMSQNIKTIGLDYSLSGKGKVSTLFENQKNIVSITNFNANDVYSLI